MRKSAKITSKGQITIPLEVRRQLGVDAGDSLLFETTPKGIRVTAQKSGESPFARYAGIGVAGVSPRREDIVAFVRGLRDPE